MFGAERLASLTRRGSAMNKPAAAVVGALLLALIGGISAVVLRAEPTPKASVGTPTKP